MGLAEDSVAEDSKAASPLAAGSAAGSADTSSSLPTLMRSLAPSLAEGFRVDSRVDEEALGTSSRREGSTPRTLAPFRASSCLLRLRSSSRTFVPLPSSRFRGSLTACAQLPWSTSNEDLIELFQTTGKVEEAEVLFESGRSKGAGVVQFSTIEEAETAIAKFQSYSYGGEFDARRCAGGRLMESCAGRPLSLEFNGRFKVFGAPEGPGADVAPAMEQ